MTAKKHWGCLVCLPMVAAGCYSPYHADQGALFGGVTGAGVGAVVGNALGDTAAGALVGAGVGAVGGAVVGSALDDMEARNRAMIEARMGRPIAAGAVTMQEVIAMSQSGVDDQLIITHIQNHGAAEPIGSQELIYLQQSGVGTRVIAAMQQPAPVRRTSASTRQPVIVEEHYYADPYWGPPPTYYRHYHGHPRYRHYAPHRQGVSWGISIGK